MAFLSFIAKFGKTYKKKNNNENKINLINYEIFVKLNFLTIRE